MNPIYTASEERRLAAAAVAEARHLRALAPTEFWSAVGRWASRFTRGPVHPAPRPQAK
jgi:hypothetical protein